MQIPGVRRMGRMGRMRRMGKVGKMIAFRMLNSRIKVGVSGLGALLRGCPPRGALRR